MSFLNPKFPNRLLFFPLHPYDGKLVIISAECRAFIEFRIFLRRTGFGR